MLELSIHLALPQNISPHSTLWQSKWMWLQTVSGVAIALAYLAIAPLLMYFADQRHQALENRTVKRKQAEEALQESESILHSFYNNTEMILGVVELLKDDILNISCNAAAAAFLQLPLESIQNQRLSHLGISSKYLNMWIRHYAESERRGSPVLFEYVHDTARDHKYFLATVCPLPKISIGPTQFSYVVEDISDRRKAEQALRSYAAQLQQSLDFEAMLKRITDKVRDSLDEDNILRTAVQELGEGLGVSCCNAALYELEAGTSTICYEYATSMFPVKGRVCQMEPYSELYTQLLQGQYFQFCSIQPNPIRGRVAMLACPLVDDQGVLGDLWLINDRDYAFRDLELRLVQQVANQCAIAIRQARLYQAAQAQVEELEKLNHLKDDFLNTVSHELRTPMSNIKLASQMLEIIVLRDEATGGGKESSPPSLLSLKTAQYFQILQDECQREIALIDDLLELSRLEAGTEPTELTTIRPDFWIPHIAESFEERARVQQQWLQINVSTDLPPLTTDLLSLERILTELLNNACKYTPPGETISLSACTVPTGLRLSVSNSGVEIPADELDRIFEKFYRVPNSDPWKHSGTGLGLALVKKRVKNLGAIIQVESTNGQTQFRVDLPI